MIAVYHQGSAGSKRIVTIEYPHAVVVLDYDRPQKNEDGSEFPSICVFSHLSERDASDHINSFRPALDEIAGRIYYNSVEDSRWLQSFSDSGETLNDRHYLTTFVKLENFQK